MSQGNAIIPICFLLGGYRQPGNQWVKKKGNKQKFSSNRKVAKTSGTALKALESRNIPKAKEDLTKVFL